MTRTTEAWQIVFTDGSNSLYTYSLPNTGPNVEPKVYATFEDAMIQLIALTQTLAGFTKVAYGEAFPYEHTSFDQELDKKGFAALGWFRYTDEDSGESVKIQIGLLRMAYLT